MPSEWIKKESSLGSSSSDNKGDATDKATTCNPITYSTGNKYYKEVDLSLSGPGLTLAFTRHYNSQSEWNGPLGYGWTTTYSDSLLIDTGEIILTETDGTEVHFVDDGTGKYVNLADKVRVIEAVPSGYELTEPDGTTMTFDAAGVLQEIADRNGNSETLTYSGGLLSAVTDNFGRSLTFSYDGNNRLETLTTPIGTYTYYYDANGNLTDVVNPATTGRSYLYEDTNDVHNITGIVNENGIRSSTVSYDNEDRAVSSERAGGIDQVTVAYTANKTRELTDTKNRTTTVDLYVDHYMGRIKSSTGPGCGSCPGTMNTQYTHDGRLLITSKTDALGRVTNYTYDSRGNKLTETQAVGTAEERTFTYTYHPDFDLVTSITRSSVANPGESAVTTFTYDANGNLTEKTESGYKGTQAVSSTTTYGYNALGQLNSVDGPRTDVTDTVTLTYYPNDAGEGLNRGELHTVENALSQSMTFAQYNAFGKPEQMTDENGVVTTYTYNTLGRLTAKTTQGRTTTLGYDLVGNLTSVELPGGRTITYTFTAADQLETISDNLGNFIAYTYDTEGNRTKQEVKDPAETLTKYVDYDYDDYNRLWKTIYPGGAYAERLYDDKGNLTQFTDPNTKVTQYGYDALDRVSLISQPGPTDTQFTYNSDSGVTGVQDAAGKLTSYDYDDLGRVVAENSPDSGNTTYEYDAAGNLLSKTDAKGITVTYTYDALNRLAAETYPDSSQNVTYTYDQGTYGVGRLTGRTDQSGSYTYTYDAFGNLTEEQKTVGGVVYTTDYTYDQSGVLTGVSYPAGFSVQYTLDADGRVQAVTWNKEGETPVTLASGITYMPFGPMSQMTLGNNISVTLSYDQSYQLTGLVHGSTLDLTYSRDNAGNVTAITDNLDANKSKTFGYDDLYRLTSATGPFGSMSYTYDAVGNRLTRTSNQGVNEAYDYVSGTNRLKKVTGSLYKRYGYDESGKPSVIAGDIATPVPNTDYVANADSERIVKTVNGSTTVFHYDLSGNLIAETDATGALTKAYVYIGALRIATIELDQGAVSGIYYHHNDQLGTPQRLTDGTGAVVWSADYEPFGKATVTTATVTNNFRFPGQYYDSETGLHYNWHRYYDPQTGRYLKPDPIGLAGGLNLYGYVSGNPVNAVDPEGLIEEIFENKGTELEPIQDPLAHLEAQAILREIHERDPNWSVLQDARQYGYSREDVEYFRDQLRKLNEGDKAPCEGAPSLDDLSEAAGVADKGGFTRAGRSLQKHGNRPGSIWNQTDINVNSPKQANPRGQDLVDDVLTTPGTKIVPNPRGGWDAISPDGRTIRFNRDGNFQGLRE